MFIMQNYSLIDIKQISVNLYWLDKNTTMVFSVPLYRNYNNKDQFIYSEFQSSSNNLIYSRIDLNWWLYIKNRIKETNTVNEFRIYSGNIYEFMQCIKTMKILLTQMDDSKKIFIKTDNKILYNNPYGPIKLITNLGDSIEFNAVLRSNELGTEKIPGISIIINDNPNEIFMPVMYFLNWVYELENINLYHMALELINLQVSRTNDRQEYESRGGVNIKTQKSINVSYLEYVNATEINNDNNTGDDSSDRKD